MELVVIGGGIVGCHIAYRLVKEGKEVFLLEKEKALGEHTSTRNSGVIHGGIYYPQESLKAHLIFLVWYSFAYFLMQLLNSEKSNDFAFPSGWMARTSTGTTTCS